MSETMLTLEQAVELAQQQAAQGHIAQAEQLLQQILQLQNTYAPAWHQLGILYAQTNHLTLSLNPLQQAVALQATNPYYQNDLGNVLLSLKHLEQAKVCFETALHYKADFAVALHNLGSVYYHQAQFGEAEKYVRAALAVEPQYAKAHYTLGVILSEVEDSLDIAFDEFQQVLKLAPQTNLPIYQGLAKISAKKAQVETALAYFYQAFQQDKNDKSALSNFLFTLNYSTNYTAAQIFAYHQQFSQHFEKEIKLNAEVKHKLHKPLRIGYVSEDLRNTHPVAYFIKSILAHHDKHKFKIYCYALHNPNGHSSEEFKAFNHTWINCFDWSDEQLIQQIKQDEIDILVDLMGHTGANRLLVFAQKPAPIQISYLGYPNTTGLKSIDYRITDIYVSPPGAEQYSSEQLIRLPFAYHCYTPLKETVELFKPSLPAVENGFITFASFNKHEKISDPILQLWVEILLQVPHSRLLIQNASMNDAHFKQTFIDYWVQKGIDSTRIELQKTIPFLEYMRLYQQVDICLDSYPYNGGTTTCHALWMGVPVISLCGETQVSRMGLSILSTVGLAELVAFEADDYVKKAVELATDREFLQNLRAGMRERLQNSMLLNAKAFTQQIELEYLRVAKLACLDE